MKKSEWSDKQLIDLLGQMPKIQDHRDPRDIYQNLSLKKRKYPIWMVPSIAAAAAILILTILVPRLINSPQLSNDRAGEEKIAVDKKADLSGSRQESTAMRKQDSPIENKELSNASQPKLLKAESSKTESSKTAVYAEEVGNGTVLTYWIPDQQAQLLVPVSTIVNEDKQKSWITLFSEKMALLKEKEWGLSDYYPINATLNVDNSDNSVTVDVPLNHNYGQGGTNETMFVNVLKKDISANSMVRKIKFNTNGESGIEFGNYGTTANMDIDVDLKHAYFFYNPKKNKTPFLVPSPVQYKDINTALAAMEQDEPNSGLKSSLPSQYFKVVSIKDNTLFLSINPKLTFKNDNDALHSFEALLLTAKEFGIQKVYINNSPRKKLGPFDLTNEIEVPIAPNLRSLE